jgi:hypothetical protein
MTPLSTPDYTSARQHPVGHSRVRRVQAAMAGRSTSALRTRCWHSKNQGNRDCTNLLSTRAKAYYLPCSGAWVRLGGTLYDHSFTTTGCCMHVLPHPMAVLGRKRM